MFSNGSAAGEIKKPGRLREEYQKVEKQWGMFGKWTSARLRGAGWQRQLKTYSDGVSKGGTYVPMGP